MDVYILRGLPGSGKSTLVKHMGGSPRICSADDYHMVNGVYLWRAENSGKAHAWCLRKFIQDVSNEHTGPHETVVVDNTNIRVCEIAPYYQVAVAFGANVKIVTLDVDPHTCADRGVHGVPNSTVFGMYANMLREERNFPPYWKHEHRRGV